MIETANNIIFWVGYIFVFILLLFAFWSTLYALFYTIVRTPKLAMAIYTTQVKCSLKNATDKTYKIWLNKIETEYREVNKDDK